MISRIRHQAAQYAQNSEVQMVAIGLAGLISGIGGGVAFAFGRTPHVKRLGAIALGCALISPFVALVPLVNQHLKGGKS